MKQTKIVIGTRGSQLSLTQTTSIKALLQPLIPNTEIEITIIKTTGDKNLSPIPLDTIGKGWFTKEIDKQLLDGSIDIAVHSLKDLLDTVTPDLTITAIPEREDAREALISRSSLPLSQLKKGAVIGTDSIRRKIQILKIRPDVVVRSVRGNVDRRLEQLDAGEYDGLFLAVAGLKRLGLHYRITQYFDETDFIPSPGQGALAIVSKESNKALNNVLSQLNHNPSVIAVTAEREFSAKTGGGCSMPVGAYAETKGNTLTLYGMIGSEDEKHVVKESISGNIIDPKGLAQKLARKMLQQTGSWYHSKKSGTMVNLLSKYVVLTREGKENDKFSEQLESLGLHTLSCPSISVTKNLSVQTFKQYLANIATYDWIFFTSSNGVRFFMDELHEIGKNISLLKNIHIAAVGPKTAETAKTYGLSVSFIPSAFTAEGLAKEIPSIQKKNILLPRSNIGNPELKTRLEAKGATVTDMPIYKTEHLKTEMTMLKKLLQTNQVLCLMFTSPSTVKGFMENLQDKKDKEYILSLPVFSIGPVTTITAKDCGFTNVYTANPHTTEGMLAKLRESSICAGNEHAL